MSRIKRTKHEQLEDAFADLSLAEQAVMLDRLASLNRWCTRERSRKAAEPKTEQFPKSGAWRCPTCGDRQDGSPGWRWNGAVWLHQCNEQDAHLHEARIVADAKGGQESLLPKDAA